MSPSARRGINLVESLVVIGIFVVVIGLMLPALQNAGRRAGRTQCQNNLKQLMLAVHNYASIHSAGIGPSGTPDKYLFPRGCIGQGTAPEDRLSWMVALLPLLEEESLYHQFKLDFGYAGNLLHASKRYPMFICTDSKAKPPSDPVTHYVALSGIGRDAAKQPAGAPGNGFMGYDRLTSLSMIKDGTSNTVAIMETREALGPWARGGLSTLRGFDPEIPLQGENPPFGGHTAGMNAAMVDGSCRFICFTIDPKVLAAAITIDGGEWAGLQLDM